MKPDFRMLSTSKKPPCAVADRIGGTIIAAEEMAGGSTSLSPGLGSFMRKLTFAMIIVLVSTSGFADDAKMERAKKTDFRAQTESKRVPKAAVDGVAGMILAFADVAGTPEQVFHALTTNETEKWWKFPGTYHLKDWKADLRVGGRWSVTVELNDGKLVHEWGEFCELSVPNKIVMTRRMDENPFVGERETTITFRLEPSPFGTLVTVRDEGFIGRPQAAYGNAENWEKVLGWLDEYLSKK
jgi:uncharacterized protein YndB with AHSA1/START domain